MPRGVAVFSYGDSPRRRRSRPFSSSGKTKRSLLMLLEAIGLVGPFVATIRFKGSWSGC